MPSLKKLKRLIRWPPHKAHAYITLSNNQVVAARIAKQIVAAVQQLIPCNRFDRAAGSTAGYPASELLRRVLFPFLFALACGGRSAAVRGRGAPRAWPLLPKERVTRSCLAC